MMSAWLGCLQPWAAEALGQRCQEPTFYGKLPVQMTNDAGLHGRVAAKKPHTLEVSRMMSAWLGCLQPWAAEALGQRCQEPTFYGKLPVQMTNEGRYK